MSLQNFKFNTPKKIPSHLSYSTMASEQQPDVNQYANAISSCVNINLISKVVDVVKNEDGVASYVQLGRVIQICDESTRIPVEVKPKLIDVFMQYDPRGCVNYINKRTSVLECINREQAAVIAEQQKEIDRLKNRKRRLID
jgi:hypothetical protein